MTAQDFDVNSLAAYLHLGPQQIERLASRDRLPGRKVGGKWRFSRAEVHHWMEERMGLLDDDELSKVETVLRRAGNEEATPVAELLQPDAIAIPLEARTRGAVIQAMAHLAADTGRLWDPIAMIAAVREREDLCSTALENGIALMHPRRPLENLLAEPLLAFGRTNQGIPFGGSRGRLTDLFFLICSTGDRQHLQVLARLNRLLNDESLLDELRAVDNAHDAHAIIEDRELRLEMA